jgi:hypothetical protein
MNDDLGDLKHAEYWEILPGQLEPDESVDSGYTHKSGAEQAAPYVDPEFNARVRLLKTHEHELPVEDPNFDESQVFNSKRWCVVVRLARP